MEIQTRASRRRVCYWSKNRIKSAFDICETKIIEYVQLQLIVF
jgi:hypothetical protein